MNTHKKIIQIVDKPHIKTNGLGRSTVQGGLVALTDDGNLFFLPNNSETWEPLPVIPDDKIT